MTITQTVEIPASHRLTIDMPSEIPAGKTQVVIQFPVRDEAHTAVPQEAKGQVNNEAFRQALRRAHGAWKDNPWKNHLEDVNAMRAKADMSEDEEAAARSLLDSFKWTEIDKAVCEIAVQIRRAKELRLPDALIAASAITLNASVLSNDSHLRDYQRSGYTARATR